MKIISIHGNNTTETTSAEQFSRAVSRNSTAAKADRNATQMPPSVGTPYPNQSGEWSGHNAHARESSQ